MVEVGESRMDREILVGMPESLAATAFKSGEQVAWEQADCARAIDWFRSKSYALLGTELWLLKNGKIQAGIYTSGGYTIFGNSCDPEENECWDDYICRSSNQAREAIAAFRWPEDSLEPSCPVYFNLCWADREWFQSSGKFVSI